MGVALKTVRIKDEAHAELSKVKGELTTRNGASKSYDEAIMELIEFWRKNH